MKELKSSNLYLLILFLSSSCNILNAQNVLEALERGGEECLYEVRDRKYNDASGNYKFVYCVIEGPDGRYWLNNNLGAEYANEKSTHFNPKQKAKSATDHLAYGYKYQWQRPADGHEIVSYTNATTATGWSSATRRYSDTWTPNHGIFHVSVLTFVGNVSWVNYTLDTNGPFNLWQAGGANNPCPADFHVPTKEEWEILMASVDGNIIDDEKLAFTRVGWRLGVEWSHTDGVGSAAGYSSSSVGNPLYTYFPNLTNNEGIEIGHRADGRAIRCIRDY